jgi:hypothetical protein
MGPQLLFATMERDSSAVVWQLKDSIWNARFGYALRQNCGVCLKILLDQVKFHFICYEELPHFKDARCI